VTQRLVALVLYSLLYYLLVGCVVAPTTPTDLTPNEELVIALSECYADPLIITVKFFDRDEGKAGKWMGYKTIAFWRSWVNEASLWALHEVTAHEVCHVLHMSGNEVVASQCMERLVYVERKCRGNTNQV
jgi:hypothetical protein